MGKQKNVTVDLNSLKHLQNLLNDAHDMVWRNATMTVEQGARYEDVMHACQVALKEVIDTAHT